MRSLRMITAAAIVLIIGCRSETDRTNPDTSIAVKTVPIIRRLLSRPVHTSGRLASSAEMKLSFKIGGIIDALFVDEGYAVVEGQCLAKLKLDEIQAQAQLARSGFEKAERDFQRVKNLHADSVATLEQLQDANTAVDVARSRLKIAEFNLTHAAITAPEDGRILKRLAEKNELIGPGHPVFLFGTSGREWNVKVGLIDRDIVRLSLGDSAHVTFDAYPQQSFKGRIREIAGAPDPANGLYEVEVSIREENARFMTGFTARVDLFPSDAEAYSVIPFEALIEVDGENADVFVPTPYNTAKKVSITIAFILDDSAVISSGLDGEERVITEGAPYLKHDSQIRLIEDEAVEENR